MREVIFLPLEKQDLELFKIKVTDSWDFAQLSVNVLRQCLIRESEWVHTKPSVIQYIKLSINDISRAYIYLAPNKYISFAMPLRYNSAKKFQFNSTIVSLKLLSELSAIIALKTDKTTLCSLYLDNGNSWGPYSEDAFDILETILTHEAGYVRHDEDGETEKRRIEKGEEKGVHPKYHLDCNYSKNATFKIGTYNMLKHDEYETIFNARSKCLFLHSHSDLLLNPNAFRKSRGSSKKNKK